jgi:hypothetical protein
MRQDRRILGYLAILVSLLCCLPSFCLSGFIALSSIAISVDPVYNWRSNDLVYSLGAWIFLAISSLAGLILVGFGLWSIFSAVNAPRE